MRGVGDAAARRRSSILLAAAAWLAFALAIAAAKGLPNSYALVLPLLWAPFAVWESRRSRPAAASLKWAAAGLAAYYSSIAAGLLLGAALSDSLPVAAVLLGLLAWVLAVVAAVAWPGARSQGRRRSARASVLAVLAFAVMLAAAAAAGAPDPGPALAVILLVAAAGLVAASIAVGRRDAARTSGGGGQGLGGPGLGAHDIEEDAAPPVPRPGGGIVWVAVGAVVILLTLYATMQLAGIESDIGRLTVYGLVGGVVMIALGAKRGVAFPAGWRLSASAVRVAVILAAVAAVAAVNQVAGADWAALAGLLSVVLVPLGWRSLARA